MTTKSDTVVNYLEGLQTIHKVIKRFHHVVLQGHMKNENDYISTTRVFMATKLGRIVTYFDGSLPLIPHDHLI